MLIREIVINDTYTPEDIEGLHLGADDEPTSAGEVQKAMLGFLGAGSEIARLHCLMPCFVGVIASYSTPRHLGNNHY